MDVLIFSLVLLRIQNYKILVCGDVSLQAIHTYLELIQYKEQIKYDRLK